MVSVFSLITLIGLIVAIVGIVKVRRAGAAKLKRGQSKKKAKRLIYIGIGAFVVGMIGVNALSNPPEIDTSKSSSIINRNGQAKLVIDAGKNSQIKIKELDSNKYSTSYKSVNKAGELTFVVDHSGKYKAYAKNEYGSTTKNIAIKTSAYEQTKHKVNQLFTNKTKKHLVAGTTMAEIKSVKKSTMILANGKIKSWSLKYLHRAEKLQPILAKKEAAVTKKAALAKAKAESKRKAESVAESESIAKAESESSVKAESESVARVESESNAKVASESIARQATADSESRAAASSVAAAQSSAAATQTANNTTNSTTSGQINTNNAQGQIVGNINSKIYHVPGQASYNMNASNAVYFSTEAEAQASGYRKSLR